MEFLKRLLLGDGTLEPKLRAELEAEGLVLVEEGLPGSVRYDRFRAPGRWHHGKVTWERIGIGLSEQRIVAYCRSGSAELIDSPYSSPHLRALDVSVEGDEAIAFRVDYDRLDVARVSGAITIRAKTPRAHEIVDQVRARLGR